MFQINIYIVAKRKDCSSVLGVLDHFPLNNGEPKYKTKYDGITFQTKIELDEYLNNIFNTWSFTEDTLETEFLTSKDVPNLHKYVKLVLKQYGQLDLLNDVVYQVDVFLSDDQSNEVNYSDLL